MNKSVKVCGCGSIHFVDNDKIKKAIEQDKNVLFVCTNCGALTAFGAFRRVLDENDDGVLYDMYAYPLKRSFVFDETWLAAMGKRKAYDCVIFDHGTVPVMKSGHSADYYSDVSGFVDLGAPDWLFHIENKSSRYIHAPFKSV